MRIEYGGVIVCHRSSGGNFTSISPLRPEPWSLSKVVKFYDSLGRLHNEGPIAQDLKTTSTSRVTAPLPKTFI